MPNTNVFADGMQYILFPGMYGAGYASYNFPESTAQDDGGGAGSVSLSFSGSAIPFTLESTLGYGRGPSGFNAYYTPLVTLNPPGDTSYGGGYDNIMGMAEGNFDPTSSPVASFYTTDPSAPNLNQIYSMDWDPAYEVPLTTEKNLCAFNSISQIGILDLVCEGPIEGLVTGSYTYNYSGKKAGDIGYTSASFQAFATVQNGQAVGAPETRSIYWDDTPLTDIQGFFNFQSVDYRFQYGEKTNQHTIYNPYIYLYEDRRNYWGREVDRNKIPLQTSTTTSINETLFGFYQLENNQILFTPKTYYIYNTEVSSIRVNLKINGLYEQFLTGDRAGESIRKNMIIRFVTYRLMNNGELILLDTSKYAPYEKDFYSIDDLISAGKVTKPLIITYEIPLRPYAENKPSFPLLPNQIGWAIDVTKMVKEFGSASLMNSLTLESITEVYSDRFVYPDAALVYSKFDARFFSSIPTRTYKLRLLKVKIPSNYDPITKTYSGTWNGKFKVAWTDNPAWCFYDLITSNRYGLGKYIDPSLTDKWTLYEIGQYCDELVSDGVGGLEPRFRCNVYITAREEAYKVLNDMASIFRGIIYYSAGQIVAAQDSPKNPIYIFNNSNVINGEFSYSDASKKSRKSIAIVRYNDEHDNYKPAIEYVEDRNALFKFGIKETEISAFGCTSKNQAKRLGKWLLTTQNTETEMVNFKAGLEGNYLKPGDVISVYDQSRKNLSYAGRTCELTTGYAVLDLPYDDINKYAITGAASNFTFNVFTPTYNLNLGTKLGDMYLTGFSDIGSSGIAGINSSFIRRSQIQSIEINSPKNYLTSGSGIYSNNIRINFPSINSIPENITPVNMSKVGNTFTKLAADGWPPTNDAQAYSSVGYTRNMFAEATSNFTNKWVFFGLDTNPIADASYTNLEYAWYFRADTNLSIFENGNNIGIFGTYTTSTKLRINYDGESITYLKDGIIMRTIDVPIKNQTLYFDSSFFSNGASINANYGTFALNNYLNTLPQNTVWTIDINPSGYLAGGINTKSMMNNTSPVALYPGYYLESYLNSPKEYRVINATEETPEVFTIDALEYNSSKYTDIDDISKLINVPVRPDLPSTPSLILSGIFRNTAGNFRIDSTKHYTTNQGGVNSIMYNIIPPRNSSNIQYSVYVNSGSNFTNQLTPLSSLIDILPADKLKTGISLASSDPITPNYYTPLGTGVYFFRVFGENSIAEKSTAATGRFILSTQANPLDVQAVNASLLSL